MNCNRFICTLMFLISLATVHGQSKVEWVEIEEKPEKPEVPVENESTFTIVEQMPEFPGGQSEMYSFIVKNIRYPKPAQEAGIAGRVYVSFVVDKDGGITDAKVIRGIGGGCDEEALRVVNMMPKWIPGTQRGKPVRVRYNLPVNFQLH